MAMTQQQMLLSDAIQILAEIKKVHTRKESLSGIAITYVVVGVTCLIQDKNKITHMWSGE